MSLRTVWSNTDLKQIFDDLTTNGGAKVTFDNVTDAENFRYACYKYRTKHNVAKDFSFVIDLDAINDEGNPAVAILIQKTPSFKLIRESAAK